MDLSEFILDNMEVILKEWESFAASLVPAATGMSALSLRDHAPEILHALAKDMRTPQTRSEQAEKSKGRARVKIRSAPTGGKLQGAFLAAQGSWLDGTMTQSEARGCREQTRVMPGQVIRPQAPPQTR